MKYNVWVVSPSFPYSITVIKKKGLLVVLGG